MGETRDGQVGGIHSRVARVRHRRQLLAQIPSLRERRQIRQRVGLSQQDLADVIGVTRETVSRWETTDRVPNDDHLARYVQVLQDLVQFDAFEEQSA